MRGHPNFILIISLLGIVVAYDINVTDLPQKGKSCHRGIDILFLFFCTKGQLISSCPYEMIVSPKTPTKLFPGFLPWPL